MKRSILFYGSGLALAAFLLQWLDFQYAVRSMSVEMYVMLIAPLSALLLRRNSFLPAASSRWASGSGA